MKRALAVPLLIALSVALPVGGAASAQSPASTPATTPTPLPDPLAPLALNPPLNHDLAITIRDRRRLPDGTQAVFTIHHRLRFIQGASGLLATLRRDAISCDGPDALCASYRQAMSRAVGTVQRFTVSRDGTVAVLVDADLLPDAAPGTPVATIAAATIATGAAGDDMAHVSAAELREALRYAGRTLNAAALATTVGIDPADISIRPVGADQVEVMSRVTMRLGTDSSVGMVRNQRDRIDLATGLVIESCIRSSDLSPPGEEMSDRDWTLQL